MTQLELIEKICYLKRDIISDGYDKALEIISEIYPIQIHKYSSGEKCWTWTIPDKWTCKEAYIEKLNGERIIDYNDNPLYVASYSEKINKIVSREELFEHIHTHQYLSDAPPFIFFYYQNKWGFCIEKDKLNTLNDEKYHVVINSIKEPGELKVGEYFIKGENEKCFVFCAHLDHPMQVNDGLSGAVTGLAIMHELEKIKTKYSYRLLILPETIGSIAWLSHNETKIDQMIGGIFLEMTGIKLPPALQLSYFGNTQLDKCFRLIHQKSEEGSWVADYRNLVGNDERQFNAPGVRVPMLSYARANSWGNEFFPYKEYHSSKDNLDILSEENLEKSKAQILKMIDALEKNHYPKNLFKGEIFLSGYNISVDRHKYLNLHRNMLRIMDMIDGTNSIIDIAQRLNIDFDEVFHFMEQLKNAGLVEKKEIFTN